MIKKIIVTIIVLLAVGVLMYKGRELLKEKEAQIASEPTPTDRTIYITLQNPKEGELESKREFLANIASLKSIKLSTKFAGYIKEIKVRESDSVKKGDLLVKIDESELLMSIKSLKSSLNSQKLDAKTAKKIYERNIKLYKAGGLPKEKLEISKVAMLTKSSMVENTKQKIAQLEHQRKYLSIVAPFDAKVDTIFLHQGDLALTGKPIIALSSNEKKLIFSFSPDLKGITKDKKVFYNSKLVGYIKSIYPTASNGLKVAEVALYAPMDKPIGSSIEIKVLLKKQKGCVVSSQTLLHKKDGIYVMTYKDKSFVPKKVDLLIVNGDKALLKSCPKYPVAKASEIKLASLPALKNVNILGANGE